MKNRALIGLSAACMSALVATAVGCGEPAVDPYTPPAEEETAVETAVTEEPAAEEETTAEAEAETDATEETTEADATDTEADAADDAEAEADATEETEAADAAEETEEAAGAEDEAETATDAEAGAEAGAAAGSYADGTYEGTGKGIGGDVPVTVTVEGGVITDVTVGDNSETQGIGSNAIEQLPELIVEANGTEGVDGVSGATITSNAIFAAVDEALASAASGDAAAAADDAEAEAEETEAAADEAATDAEADAATEETEEAADAAEETEADAETATDAEAGALADGTYEGTGKGIGGDVPVTVTVEGGVITDVTVGDNSETQGIGSNAIEQLPELIVEANGTEGVDGVSGATITSNAIFAAVDEALASAASGDAAAAADDAEAEAEETEAAADEAATDAEADAATEETEEAADAAEETEADAETATDAEAGAEAEAAAGSYADGTYEGTGKGIGGDVPVTVTVEGGVITDVTVGDNSETQGIGSNAIEQLPELIVEANGTEGVDGVSGATITSNAIFAAVDEALASAASGDAAAAADDAEAEAEETEAAADEAATDAEADAATEETEEAADAAEETEADAETATDAEAGAEAEAAAGSYADGTYEGTGKGIGGDVPVTVTVEGGVITDVTVGDNSETQGIGSNAIEQLPELIVEANGTEGVDGVSGATITSNAIFAAVDEALASAASGDAAAAADDAEAEAEETEAAADEAATDAEADAATEETEEAADAAEETEADAETATDAEAGAEAEAAAGSYADGTYEGTGKGIGGDVPVTVTVEGGVITDVTVGDNSETQGIGSNAIEQLPELIVEANGTEGVDGVSGATITSNAIFAAVDEALASAASGDAAAAADDAEAEAEETEAADAEADATEETTEDEAATADEAEEESTTGTTTSSSSTSSSSTASSSTTSTSADKDEDAEETEAAADEAATDAEADADAEAGALADGTYEASGKGIGGDVPVTVTVKDGAIESVEVGDNSETQGIGSNAIEQLPEQFVGLKTAEEVDALDGVSGATITSNALKTAVADCLEQASAGDAEATDEADADADKADEKDADAEKTDGAASADGEYADGTYEGTGKGIGGDVPVTVTVKDGAIESVEVGDNSETQGIGSNAIEQLPELIVEANGTEGVDGVSGATITSNAIFAAVEEALEQAQA